MADAEDNYLEQFDPYRGAGEWVTEDPRQYAARMQRTLLPLWPEEVLIEWFHRHARHIHDYAFLRFERFRFERQRWPLAEVPGREVFGDPGFCDDFRDIELRAQSPDDWLANHMLEHGTWNTPIILLRTPQPGMTRRGAPPLRYPIHLLEGHRRLSFLLGLRMLGRAQAEHEIWLVSLAG